MIGRASLATAALFAIAAPEALAASPTAPYCAYTLPAPAMEQVRGFTRLRAGWIVHARNGSFYLPESLQGVRRLSGAAVGPALAVHPLTPDVSLLLTRQDDSGLTGAYRFDARDLYVQEVWGSEGRRVLATAQADGGLLLGTDKGLFRLDSAGQEFRRLPGPATGAVATLQPLDQHGWLLAAHNGLFRVDPRGGRIDSVPGADTGTVTAILRLGDGGSLVGSERGLFRADATGRVLTTIPGRKVTRVLEIAKVGDGGWLVRADNGLFAVDTDGKRVDGLSDDPGASWMILVASDKGALLQSEAGLYAYALPARRLEVLPFEPGPGATVLSATAIADRWLVSTRRGLFSLDLARARLAPIKGQQVDRVIDVVRLRSGSSLLRSPAGVFRVDAALQSVQRIGPAAGDVVSLLPLEGSAGALVATDQGLFWADEQGSALTRTEGTEGFEVGAVVPLPGGGWLVSGGSAYLRVDAEARRAAPFALPAKVRGAAPEMRPDGGMLFGGATGVLATPAPQDRPLGDLSAGSAAASWGAWARGDTVLTLRHPCAASAAQLGVVLEARRANTPAAAPVLLPARVIETSDSRVTLAADAEALRGGDWTIRATVEAGGPPLSQAIQLARPDGVAAWFRAHAASLLLALAAVHALAGAGLFIAAGRGGSSLALLQHPLWAALLIWPSLALRYSARARRWILRPWFYTVRASTRGDTPFLDVELAGPAEGPVRASSLLERVRLERLWLSGRLGIGKSQVLAAWQRSFFLSHARLRDAVSAYGFIPVPVGADAWRGPAGQGATPERVLVDAVRDRLAAAGVEAGSALVRRMVARGELALLIDDATSADRDGPIAAFVRACPRARLAVASTEEAPAGFEAWHLPPDPSAQTEALLGLWLGAYSGSRLAVRLGREGVQRHVATSYDVRLLADEVIANPDAELPGDRAGFYRLPLARAVALGVPADRLDVLKRIAWAMTLESRVDLGPEEAESLSPGLDGLVAARVLRARDGRYAFEHELLQLFVAALWAAQTRLGPKSLSRELDNNAVWKCARAVQEELWAFLAGLVPADEATPLWTFALSSAERAHLQVALYARARATNRFPLGLAQPAGVVAHLARRRSASPGADTTTSAGGDRP